jgi:hypothetical protein
MAGASDVDEDAESLVQDFSGEPEVSAETLSVPHRETIAARQETLRGRLAASLVGLVVAQVLIGLVAVTAGVNVGDVTNLLERTLPPSVALAGPPVGFYFAGRDRDL